MSNNMEEPTKRILFVNSEIFPYLPESQTAHIGRYLPQGIQERKHEIRSFMPRYGRINERKNQLHEVIRLSGMNIIINDVDRPLIIKVASIPSARLQVYFIDNEDYFKRRRVFRDEKGKFLAVFGNASKEDLPFLSDPSGINLAKTATQYSDGIIMAADRINPEIVDYCKELSLPMLEYDKASIEDGSYIDGYNDFYDRL